MLEFFKNKENLCDFDELNKMIEEITTGVIGEVIKKDRRELYNSDDIDEIYEYSNNAITMNYNKYGFSSKYNTTHKSCSVFYNNNNVYRSTDGIVFHVINDKTWVKEIYNIYKNHLEVTESKRNEFLEKQAAHERALKVRSIFELVRSEGYSDDKIIIDEVEYYSIPAPDWSNSKDETILNGRIRLIDGTVLMDTRKGIYHPGKWENYVCSLVNLLTLRKNYEQHLKKEEYEKANKIKQLELKRKYMENHSPIDDSKYF